MGFNSGFKGLIVTLHGTCVRFPRARSTCTVHVHGPRSQVRIVTAHSSLFSLILWSHTLYVEAHLRMRNSYLPPGSRVCAPEILTWRKMPKFTAKITQRVRISGGANYLHRAVAKQPDDVRVLNKRTHLDAIHYCNKATLQFGNVSQVCVSWTTVTQVRSKDSQVKTQLVLWIFILFKVARWQHVSASITRPSSGHK